MEPDINKFTKSQIIMFSSTFCSKCLFNRKLWKEVTNGEPELIEINISEDSNRWLLEKLKPRVSPTIVLLNNSEAVFSYEGILNSQIIQSILQMHSHISQD